MAITAEKTSIKFQNSLNRDFTTELNKRVKDYLKTRKYGRYANGWMVFKTIFMLSLYFVPYFIYISGAVTQYWVYLILISLQGIGTAGIGLSIMHDANHGAYAKNKLVNKLLGYTLNLVGGNATNWKIQHNVMHHTYTNIADYDEDISPRPILRFSPHSKRMKLHKYQYIYAWFLYGLMTFTWVLFKDFIQLVGYTKSGVLAKQTNEKKAWVWLVFTKLIYFGYALVIPLIVLPFAGWQVLLGFFITHYIAGFILGIIFQPAHVMEENDFPLPEEGKIEDNWTVHQLRTTINFAKDNRVLSWFVGGLNYQVEHHLFPNICHIHYRKISDIVEKTAKEYNLPYKSIPTFRQALISHGRMLYKLGRV